MTESISPQILHVIDASLNRAAEVLRFAEDSARFILNNAELTIQLKTAHHGIIRPMIGLFKSNLFNPGTHKETLAQTRVQ